MRRTMAAAAGSAAAWALVGAVVAGCTVGTGSAGDRPGAVESTAASSSAPPAASATPEPTTTIEGDGAAIPLSRTFLRGYRLGWSLEPREQWDEETAMAQLVDCLTIRGAIWKSGMQSRPPIEYLAMRGTLSNIGRFETCLLAMDDVSVARTDGAVMRPVLTSRGLLGPPRQPASALLPRRPQ